MNPWWLRPFTDGAPDDNEKKKKKEAVHVTDIAEAASDLAREEKVEKPPRRRRRRGKGRGDGEEAGEDAGKDASGADEKAGGREESRQDDKKSDRKGGRQTEKKGSRRGGGSSKDRGDDKEAGKEAGKQAGKETGKQAGGEEDPQPAPQPRRLRRRPVQEDDFFFDDYDDTTEAINTKRSGSVNDERTIALFCDLENIALGVRDSEVKKFDINLVLERLLEKGKIIVKKAYCDWERYNEFKRPFHEAAIEMIDIPQKYYAGKNSADIKLVVDAIDLCYAKDHLDTFVILSGDSDFTPLVSKLKENNKYVIAVGVKGSSSNLLIDNCDEFIYYEDVWRSQQAIPKLDGMPQKTAEVFALMVDAIQALVRENKDVLWGSMIKQTMQRKKPSFNEGYYGYGSFSELLEAAEENRILKLKKDQRSGSYIVTGFAGKRR